MPSTTVETRFAPCWLHAWSVLTACATVALLALGAVVTTFQVGMADPIWPTVALAPGAHRLARAESGFRHRAFAIGWPAYVVGCCVIVLTVGLLLSARRSWLKWLGVAALAGVIVQGLLGGFRVVLHAWLGTKLAIIHGCFAQIVFSLLVSLAVVTSARFAAETLPAEEIAALAALVAGPDGAGLCAIDLGRPGAAHERRAGPADAPADRVRRRRRRRLVRHGRRGRLRQRAACWAAP